VQRLVPHLNRPLLFAFLRFPLSFVLRMNEVMARKMENGMG